MLRITCFRCALPNWPNDTYKIQSEAHMEDVNRSIPLSSEDGYLYDGCTIYGNNSKLVHCEKWVYAKTVFESTFTSEVFSNNSYLCKQLYFLI